MRKLYESKIPIEICYSSNLACKNFEGNHLIHEYHRNQHPFIICVIKFQLFKD
jgi:hypothetical protein